MIVDWNDPDALVAATERHELAAILAEPYPANMGLVPPRAGFLALLRERADATGALLVFDEVISGFRVAPGGAHELTGVTPDLAILGKVIGGGLPAGAVGGRRELMEMLAPAGDVYQAGTLSGNPLAVAAGWPRSRCSTRAPTCVWPPSPSSSPRDCATPRAPGRSRSTAPPGCSRCSSAPRRWATWPTSRPAT